MDWALRIRSARHENTLSQSQMGEALGVTQGAVSLWERGEVVPPPARQTEVLAKLPQTAAERWLKFLRATVQFSPNRCALIFVGASATYLDCYSPLLAEHPRLFSPSDLGRSLHDLFPDTYGETWPQVLELGTASGKPHCVRSLVLKRVPGKIFLAEAINIPFLIEGAWWFRTDMEMLDPATAIDTTSKLAAVSLLE